MSKSSLDLCVGVVGGNNPQMALDCLHSLIASLDNSLKVEIHFVDNASPPEWFKDVHKISAKIKVRRNKQRRGFGANHNTVISSVDARYYLLLNDDTFVHPGCCERLVAAAESNKQIGFIGPKLLNGDGTIQPSVYRFPSPQLAFVEAFLLHRIFPLLPGCDDYRGFNYDRSALIDYVSGAALLVKRETVRQIGLLDEEFFMYSEEADWCLRGLRAGWLTAFTPQACVVHYGGQSTVSFRPERSVEFLRSHSRFVEKHFGVAGLRLYKLCNFFKHSPRALFAIVAGWSEDRRQAESDIVLWSMGRLNRSGLRELAASAAKQD